MSTGKILGITGAIVIIIGGGLVLSNQGAERDSVMEKGKDAMMEKDDKAMVEKESDAMMQDDSATGGEDGAMMQKGTYEPYGPEKIALAADQDVLLFFHANWCPICRNIESEIGANPAALPSGPRILKVNYDTEVALRQKYGVTVQHTFVQVDATGSAIQKFSDASTLGAVLARVK